MLIQNIDYFKNRPLNLPKVTILSDCGYQVKYIRKSLEEVYPEIMNKIRLQLSAKLSKYEKKEQKKLVSYLLKQDG